MRTRAAKFLIVMAVTVMTLATASLSSAGTFVWKNVDGKWADYNNWTQTSGGPSAGFPNQAGDIAEFTLAYTTQRKVTLPNGEITVGVIRVNRSWITILPDGPQSRLVIDNGSSPALIVKSDGQSTIDSLEIQVPMRLRSNLILEAAQNTGINVGFIGQSYAPYNVIKRGRGRVIFATPTNGYTGLTTVEDGELNLAGGFGNSIMGDLTIGDGIGARNSARVTTFGSHQIEDHATVRVRSDGRYEPSGPDRIGRLIVGGGLTMKFGSVTADAITLDGALVEIGDEMALPDELRVIANPLGPSVIRQSANAKGLTLGASTRTIVVEDGPAAVDLEIAAKITGTDAAGLIKDGTGTLRLAPLVSNTYPGTTRVSRGRLEVTRLKSVTPIPGRLEVGGGADPAAVALFAASEPAYFGNSIATGVDVIVGANGSLTSDTPEVPRGLVIDEGGRVTLDPAAIWVLNTLTMTGGQLTLNKGSLRLAGHAALTSSARESASIAGDATTGGFSFTGPGRSLFVADGPQAIDLRMTARTGADVLSKRGAGALAYEPPAGGALAVNEGATIVSGTCASCAFTLTGGVLGGTGTIGKLTATGGTIAPGTSPGRLVTQALSLAAGTTFAVEVQGTTAGSGYDQVDVRGAVSLGQATLQLAGNAAVLPTTGATLTIVANDDSDPVAGTFAGLAEGATIAFGTRELTISYRGGDGNDVVLVAADTTPFTYFLAEGATGAFFDDDVLIANPNDVEAPVTLTFLQEGGATVVEHRTLPAQSRLTVHVDQIPGLEASAASVQVASDDRRPLIVERTMFWDASYYGGHTANAVDKPETRWIFAEGSQGFFDTYVLIANANDQQTTATLTFLREGEDPFVTTVTIDAFTRKTVYVGDYAELRGRSFGIVVDAAAPVIAERAMYFATLEGKLWSGGHANTGIAAPSTSWFHAEGATGGFTTFILLSNPQDTAAHVELRFLLDNGDVITRTKTIEARQRLTINPAAEGDARLENAALSTVVRSDVPIVSERSMYWAGDARPFGEGHNSAGVIDTATRWGLAEGRLGGEHAFDTFILLANPSPQPAQVTITFLREHDAPIVRTYEVAATSRFNVDVKESVPELRDSSFGAKIEVTNGVPIAVERSLYWNSNGAFWAGGTNALATRLP